VTESTYALTIAGGLSILVATIEIPSTSKTTIRSSLSAWFLIYLIILIFGNSMTTLVAGVLIPKEWPIPQYVSSAFIGVFGFQVVLKNMNVKIFDKGVLSIEDWIAKARDLATASAIRTHAVSDKRRAIKVAERLKANPNLNAFVTQFLGAGVVTSLDAIAIQNQADPLLIKAFALAFQKPEEAGAL